MTRFPNSRIDYGNQSECLNVSTSMDSACNNSCMFCVDNDQHGPGLFKKFENEIIYKILRDNRSFKKVCFGGGGEPTLSPNLINYIKYAREQGYQEIAVVSNGRQYRDVKYCLDLIQAGVREFTVSIHGHSSIIHDTLTRHPGSFAQTVDGLRNFSRIRQSLPIRVNISHVVNRVNYRFLDRFFEFVAQYLVDIVILNTVQPRGDNMEENFLVLMPQYKEVARKIENIFFKKSELLKSKLSPFEWFVSIVEMPVCVSKRLFFLAGFGKIRLIRSTKNYEVRAQEESSREYTLLAARRNTNVSLKEKSDKCLECQYNCVCEGVFSNYVKHFGWSEFVPITK